MTTTSHSASVAQARRLARHRQLTEVLDAQSDVEMLKHIQAGTPLGIGIGGSRCRIDIAGAPVFVKRIPLTDVERQASLRNRTANIFELPNFCHYGVGSPSFGAWRECIANQIATQWVTDRRCDRFVLLHHCRQLNCPSFDGALPSELADIDQLVAHCSGSPAVRRRIEAIASSSASLVLFFEYLPFTLPQWLDRTLTEDPSDLGHLERTLAAVEQQLLEGVAQLDSAGCFHFDAHLDNILADDHGLYFTDFGLATASTFDLSDTEAAFLDKNRAHDVCHVITRWVDWLVTRYALADGARCWRARNDLIRRIAANESVAMLAPPPVADRIRRYASVAVLINDFYTELHRGQRATEFPAAAAQARWEACRLAFASPRMPAR